jgi:uncharacterized OsmC-like protein
MTSFTGKYLGNKKVELTHLDSGVTIVTDAPKDNHGDGTSFSPTDLFASSLGACQLTVMSIYAERTGISLEGSWFNLSKHMSAAPRMVSKIIVEMHLPRELNDVERLKLEQISKTCPVHHSLNASVQVDVRFFYDVELKKA